MFESANIQNKTDVELQHIILSLQSELQQQHLKIDEQLKQLNAKEVIIDSLLDKIKLAKIQKFAAKSEKASSDQFNLFDEAQLPSNVEAVKEAEAAITIASHQRKKGGRKPLPKNLPVKEQVYDLTEAERQCDCGHEMAHITDELSEQIEVVPQQVYIIRHIKKKYACKHCELSIKTAKMPKQIIPKSIAAPGTLAYVMISKYADHLPFYRQEQIFQRMGIELLRGTMSRWAIVLGEWLEPLYKLLLYEINQYDVAYSDETPVQVLKEKGRLAQAKSYMWLIGGGAPGKFCYYYYYDRSRRHDVVNTLLEDFKGYLHCDGFSGYDTLAGKRDIVLVGCNYHARRKFVEAAKVSEKDGLAREAVKRIAELSLIEREAKNLDSQSRYELRQKKSVPKIAQLKQWLDEKSLSILPESLIGKAISYTLKQWPKLIRFLEDGRLEFSNNKMEQKIRPFAIGRKNWMFFDRPAGAKAGAIFYSLFETCKAHGVEPYSWLRYVFTRLPQCQTEQELQQLLPFNIDPAILSAR